MVVTMVMVSAYCYGPRTHTCPRQKGSFLAIFQYGGASAAFRYRPTRKQGLQGLRFAPGGTGRRAECPVSAGLCVKAGEWETCEPRCVPGLQVCTRPHENGQGRKLNAGAGLQTICRLNCRNRPTSEPDSVTVEGSVLAGACDHSWSKKGKTVRACRSAMNTV